VTLESTLRERRSQGRPLLVPYVTGGLHDGWTEVVEAVVAAGADAVEIGIPFSDPVMDGPTIQAASQQALAAGATPTTILGEVESLHVEAPLAVMTYVNLVMHAGYEHFAAALVEAGVDAAILPDLPLDEFDDWATAADSAGIETVLLAAPTTSDERLARICARSKGFVYAVSLLGVTGERSDLATPASTIGERCRAHTDTPVLLGVGISTPEQAAEAVAHADGVVVGSALVRRLLEGGGVDAAADFVRELRQALDAAPR